MIRHSPIRKRLWRVRMLGGSIAVITLCELFLLADIAADLLRLNISTPWLDHSDIELIAVISMAIALIIMGMNYWRLTQEARSYREVVRTASGRLLEVIQEKFNDWMLTDSEREIALLLIKGMSIQEIADIRNTKPGTIKSHSNAIYRKAGIGGRLELVAYFVEDLLAGEDLASEQ